jgi:hypothetical protein
MIALAIAGAHSGYSGALWKCPTYAPFGDYGGHDGAFTGVVHDAEIFVGVLGCFCCTAYVSLCAHRVDSLRCEGSDAIGAKRTCRERRERVDLTKMTPSRHRSEGNPALQRLLLTEPSARNMLLRPLCRQLLSPHGGNRALSDLGTTGVAAISGALMLSKVRPKGSLDVYSVC